VKKEEILMDDFHNLIIESGSIKKDFVSTYFCILHLRFAEYFMKCILMKRREKPRE